MAQKPFIVPIPGTTKIHHLEEDLGALDVTFTAAELEDFRSAIEGIELVGVDPPKAALTDG
jgi:aryl-alcohol dehydrogenase-like predicted oxidoreductase